MKVLSYLLQKEFLQIFRDKIILVMMFGLPTMQLIIIPFAMDFDVKHVNLVVLDNDHSSMSQRLISKINSSGYFHIVGTADSYRQGLDYIEHENADIVLEIPPAFERKLVREGRQEIGLFIDAINGNKAGLGSNYLMRVIGDFNEDISLRFRTEKTPGSNPGIQTENMVWYNPHGEYKYYMVPGVLVLLLTLIGGFISALNIVREKEMGTIEQINVSPVQKWQFILGKLIPFWVVGMIIFSVGLLVQWIVYGIVPAGSFLVLYLFAGIYLVALLGFGLLVSTFTSTQLQAMFVAFFFMMIFMLMSGLFTSVDSMPSWARTIANLTPITHFVKVVRMIVLKGSGFADIKTEFLYQFLFAVVLNGWAILNYRKTS